MVQKLWPEQKFKLNSWLFKKSRADNFRTQAAIKIPKDPGAQRNTSWRFTVASLKNSNGNCSKLQTDRLMDGRTGL